MPARIAIIGDLHSAWDDADVTYFNQSAYPLLLFTGDLGASTRKDGIRIAKSISRIERNVLVMPGNNDVEQYGTLAAELAYRRGAKSLLRAVAGQASLMPAHKTEARMCGYSSHTFGVGLDEVTIIAGRPFSFGGPRLWFEHELAKEFGVRSFDESVARIVALAQAAPTRDLILLSHNGPAGLGDQEESPWGRDFELPACDWGDTDLAQALDVIRADTQHRVLAVVAGHMHSPTRSGKQRAWQAARDGVLFVNPACVPRLVEDEHGLRRHHVALEWNDTSVTATEHWIADPA